MGVYDETIYMNLCDCYILWCPIFVFLLITPKEWPMFSILSLKLHPISHCLIRIHQLFKNNNTTQKVNKLAYSMQIIRFSIRCCCEKSQCCKNGEIFVINNLSSSSSSTHLPKTSHFYDSTFFLSKFFSISLKR